eukprot:667277-Pelagomonas_calceolata.AAC.1
MYDADEYILKDGEKNSQVHPNTVVKQGCPLSSLLFSLYINDVDEIADSPWRGCKVLPRGRLNSM